MVTQRKFYIGVTILVGILALVIWRWSNRIDISQLKPGMAKKDVDRILVWYGGATKVRIPIPETEKYLYCYIPLGNYFYSLYYMSDTWREDIVVSYKNDKLENISHTQSLTSDFCK